MFVRPPQGRKRKAYDLGVASRQRGDTVLEASALARSKYGSPTYREALMDGWRDADLKAMWESFPTCPVCHQPCAPPESEEERLGLDRDHPWHPESGRKLPQYED